MIFMISEDMNTQESTVRAVILTLFSLFLNFAANGAEWPMKQRDIGNTGRADYIVPSSRMNGTFFDSLLWQKPTPGSPSDGNLSSSTMVFFDGAGTNGADIVVGGYQWPIGMQGMDRHTGKFFWAGNPDGGESIGGISAAFSTNGQTIYVANDSTPHPQMAFSAITGPSVYWHNGGDTNPASLGAWSPKVAPDGRVFTHGFCDDQIGALTDDGIALHRTWWAATALDSCNNNPALFLETNRLLVVSGGRSGLVKAFDGNTGAEVWSVDEGHPTDADATIDPSNGNIYLPAGFDSVFVVGLTSQGQPLWGPVSKPVFSWQDGLNNQQLVASTGCLSHDGSTYYFQTVSQQGDGRLYAINTTDGSVKWSFNTQSSGWDGFRSSPVVTRNGVLVVGNNENGTYYALRDIGSSAVLLDTLPTAGGTASSSATMAPEGTLYLPARLTWTQTNGDADVPTQQAENLFNAFNLDGVVGTVLPAPAGLQGNTAVQVVNLSWSPDTNAAFARYAVYRFATPFTSVIGLTPIGSVTNQGQVTYADHAVRYPQSYYYAVTAVSTTGDETNQVSSIGPFSPPAQPVVVFPDPNLEAAVLEELNLVNGPVTLDDIQTLTSLTANNRGITNLSGLEWATNLTSLNLYNNQITSLSVLANLRGLQSLDFFSNQVHDLSPINGLTNLDYLSVGDNPLTNVFLVAGMTNLTGLVLCDLELMDISVVQGLWKLTYLCSRGNLLTNIAPIAGLTNLTEVFLGRNLLTDIAPIVGLTKLTTLAVDENLLTNITPVPGLTKLTRLIMPDNLLADITPIVGLTNLIALNLSENLLTNVVPIAGLTNLTGVYLGRNLLTDITPIAGLTNLTELDLFENRLTNVALIAGLTKLTTLGLSGIPLTSINSIAGLTNLTQLYLGGNLLTNIAALVDLLQLQTVTLYANHLNVSPGSPALTVIQTLQGRGVTVDYLPQLGPALNPIAFNGDSLNTTGLTFTAGGQVYWFAQASNTHDGLSAAQSGGIPNSEESWLETTATGPGTLSYWWRVSSEDRADYFEYYVDGVRQTRISGEIDWRVETFRLGMGTHTLRWRYTKDSFDSAGADAGWLDQVSFIPDPWLELIRTPTNNRTLIIHGTTGRFYEIQASTNLVKWSRAGLVVTTNSIMPFVEPGAEFSSRFYRLMDLQSAVWLGTPSHSANGPALIPIQSAAGLKFDLQASTNLATWSLVKTLTNTTGTLLYTDTLATNAPRRFYRVQLAP